MLTLNLFINTKLVTKQIRISQHSMRYKKMSEHDIQNKVQFK